MKKILTLIIMVLAVALAMAQTPENFSFQAVVRNANNSLVANAQVGVRVNILQGSPTGNAVYSESHVTSSNANGLVTVNIGGGSVLHGSFTGIDWSDGPYFLKTDIDPNGGNDYTITSTQQLLSVPYALYAKEAANGFSGDYNDLTNLPQIPQIPADVSAFNNDAGYITAGQVPAQVNADWNATSGAAEILNKPTIPTVPTNVSAFTNDAGYITGYTETDPQFTAWDKDYNDLINKPAIPTVPTNVSAFTNDAGYITSAAIPAIPTVPTNVSAFTNDAGYITAAQVPAQVNADWNATSGAAQILNKPALFSGNYNDLTNKPVLFSGNYNDLTNKPTLFDGNYNSLTNRPNLAAVAISGSYNDLINKPSIPTAVGELTNNVGYITQAQVPAQVNADWNATSGAAQILNKPTLFSGNYNDLTNKPVLFSGDYNDLTNLPQIPQIPADISAFNNDAGYLTSYTETDPQFNAWDKNYNDLTNKPTIPTVPANVSAFTNDAGYLTGYTETDPQFNAWDKSYNDLTNKPVLFSGDYNDLANKPTIPTVPANVSAFTNDAGYLTSFTEQQVLSISNDTLFLTGGSFVKLPAGFDGDYNSLTNKPAIPTVPTNVSAFTNDAGYITAANVQEAANIPTNVSAFNNDAGYITSADIPEIPAVPTNVSAFTNDAGYLTEYIEQQVLSISNDTLFLTGGSFVKLPAGFDGDYNSLTNTPTIPTTVGELTNDANYITIEEVPAQVNADWNATEGAAQILNKPELFDGDYNSLTNTPTIPTVPTNVSAFTNDAGYITAANVQEAANIPTNVSAFNNDAGYITSADIPEIPAVPTNVSAFTNDAGYLTEYIEQQVLSISNDTLFLTGGSFVKLPAGFDGDYNSLTNTPTIPTTVGELTNDVNYITIEEVPGQVNADWNATEGAAQILNKPELFDGNYNSLINKPNLATVATTGNYNDLVNKPILFSGNYNDLSNTPTIPTVNNATLTIQKNGGSVGTFSANASSNKTVNITVPTTTSELINTSGFITVANLPSVPTQVSELDNDAGYITQAQLDNANYIANTGDACGNTVDLCQLMNTIATLQNQVQELSSTVGVNPYGTASDASCPTRMVVIEGNPNVCYYGPSYGNVILTAWLDGSIALDATYTWFKNGEQRPNSLGYDNHYMETWEPTYDNPYLFTVQITTNDGCVYTSAPFKVNVYDRPYVTISSTASEVCAGGEVSLRANLQNYNTPMITYQWYENQVNNNNILPARTHEVETFAPNMTTDYIVKVTHLMDYNTQYCIAYDTFHVEVSDCIPSDGESNCCSALSDAIDSLRGMITHLNYVIDTLTFTCGTSTVTDHEGNVYHTVQIGNQCWTKENLRTTTSPSTGTYIVNNEFTSGAYAYTYTGKMACWYNNDSATYAPMNYGLLYNWNAAVDTFNTAYGETSVNNNYNNAVAVMFDGHRRGICPAGWHLPSSAEWNTLTNFVSSQSEYVCDTNTTYIAKALADSTGWNNSTIACAVGYNQGENNATGFGMLPAGTYNNGYYHCGNHAYFWSATQNSNTNTIYLYMRSYDTYVHHPVNGNKYNGYSVRCLRDETGGARAQ